MRKKLLEIGYEYGRSKQSKYTGFLHFEDQIPIYDNLLFALLLIQTKTVDHVLEGVELVEKLLGFQTVSGFFPRHIHEYPKVAQINHQVEILDVLRRFAPRFEPAIQNLETAIQSSSEPLHPVKQYLLGMQKGIKPDSIRSWEEYLKAGNPISLPSWDHDLMVCCEPIKQNEWIHSVPHPTYIDLYMACLFDKIPARLQKGVRSHLATSLLPFEFPQNVKRETKAVNWIGSTFYTGTMDDLYSLTLETKGDIHTEENMLLLTLLCQEHPIDQDIIEFCLYFPCAQSSCLINGEKQTTFSLNDVLLLEHPYGKLVLTFSLEEGNGVFMGHISRFDRLGQIKTDTSFSHYDYCITMRSLRRTAHATLSIQVENVSKQAPDYRKQSP